MRKRLHYFILSVIIIVCFNIGIISKQFHKKINDYTDDFYVGLIDKNLVDSEIKIMRNNLDNSKYILLITCREGIEFDFSYGTQKVSIDSIIKGDNKISIGDEIDIIKIDTIFIPDDKQYGSFNMGFISELKVGKKYIVFLNEIKKIDDSKSVFVYDSDYFISPYFPIDKLFAYPIESDLSDGFFSKYNNAKEQDVLMMSYESINQWEMFRKEIIEKYIN